MDCVLTITLTDGTEIVLTTDEIHSPKYDPGCFTPETFTERVSEFGVVTSELDGNGNIVINRITPKCICQVNFVAGCEK